MKIAISLLNFRPGSIGGAETYIRRLIAAMTKIAGDDRISLATFRDNAAAIDPCGANVETLDASDRKVVLMRCLEAFTPMSAGAAMKLFDKLAPDVALFPQQSIFPKKLRCPAVMTVVDIQHLFFPQYFGLFDRTFRAAIYPKSLHRADHIITISHYTRKTLIERCGVDPEKVTAVPFGVDASAPASADADNTLAPELEKFLAGQKFLFYPAATFPHKNHRTLLTTMAALKKSGDWTYKLVLTGKKTALWDELSAQTRDSGLADDVIHLGFVPFEEVGKIYRRSVAVVFPTQFEGFGLPVVEAVQFGKKVICSRLEVFDEIGVPQENQIDFAQPEQLRTAMQSAGATILTKPLMTWEDNARMTLDILRRTAGKA